MDIVDFLFYDLFPTLLGLFDRVFGFLGSSLSDLLDGWLNFDLPNWAVFQAPLLVVMLGSSIVVFCSMTLVKWIIDIVT